MAEPLARGRHKRAKTAVSLNTDADRADEGATGSDGPRVEVRPKPRTDHVDYLLWQWALGMSAAKVQTNALHNYNDQCSLLESLG